MTLLHVGGPFAGYFSTPLVGLRESRPAAAPVKIRIIVSEPELHCVTRHHHGDQPVVVAEAHVADRRCTIFIIIIIIIILVDQQGRTSLDLHDDKRFRTIYINYDVTAFVCTDPP